MAEQDLMEKTTAAELADIHERKVGPALPNH